MSAVVLSHLFTCQEQKDTLTSSAVPNRLIALFHSFEFASSLHQKDLTFSQTSKPELIQYAFSDSTVASEMNAQWNKVSPQGEKSSGNAHLRRDPGIRCGKTKSITWKIKYIVLLSYCTTVIQLTQNWQVSGCLKQFHN